VVLFDCTLRPWAAVREGILRSFASYDHSPVKIIHHLRTLRFTKEGFSSTALGNFVFDFGDWGE
jgi:hypothetical protein